MGAQTVARRDRSERKLMQAFSTGLLAAASIWSLAACSSLEGSSDSTWRANFFENPDSVWAAIELSLIELDYEINEKNRPDGVIRAQSEPAEDGTVIALSIDQVMRTEDQVSVYVKPSFGGDGGSANPDLLKAAADELVKTLKAKLGD